MLNEKIFANSAAIVTALTYSVCLILVMVFPGVVYGALDFVFHGLNIEVLKPTIETINLGKSLIGLVVISAYSWLTLYAFAYVYNKLATNA